MNTDKATTTATNDTPRPMDVKPPSITRKIGNTTFDIHIHFSETSKETFTDKVLRLIKNDPAADTQRSFN
jgi:hypothetical protein